MNIKSVFGKLVLSVTAVISTGIHDSYASGKLSDWQGVYNKNDVYRIIHDEDNLYVSSYGGGITVINKNTGEQQTLNRANDRTFDNTILEMAIHDGIMWAGGHTYGLGKITSSGYEKIDMKEAGFLLSQDLNAIYVESSTDIYLGGLLAVYRFNGSKCTKVWMLNPLSPYVAATDIKKSSEGQIYVSCAGWGAGDCSLYMLDGDELISIPNPYPQIYAMAFDGDTMWLAANHDGLVKYEDNTFTRYNSQNSDLPFDAAYDLKVSQDGTLWVVGNNNYLAKVKDGLFTSYALPEEIVGNQEYLRGLDIDGEIVYVGTKNHGLFKFENGEFSNIPLIDNPQISNININSCPSGNNNFLIAGREGLSSFNTSTGQPESVDDGLLSEVCVSPTTQDIWVRGAYPDYYVKRLGNNPWMVAPAGDGWYQAMCFDNTGKLWVATAEGLMCIDGNSTKYFTSEDAGFPISDIMFIHCDSKNRVWCGAFSGHGLIMFDGDQWYNYTRENSNIPSDYVGPLTVDKNDVVWMNCRSKSNPDKQIDGYGLTSFDGESWRTYNTGNSGLPYNNIYAMTVDADNTKWIACCHNIGVVAFDGENWDYYNVDNSGLALNNVLNISIDDTSNTIWFVQDIGGGCSYASLRPTGGDVDNIPSEAGESMLGHELSVYTLQGVRVYHTPKYTGEQINLAPGLYIIVSEGKPRKVQLTSEISF